MAMDRQTEEMLAKSKKLSIIAGVAGGVAVLSIGLAGFSMNNANAIKQRYEGDLVSVVVPTEDIASNTVLTADMLTTQQIPSMYVPTNVVTADDMDKIINHKAIVNLTAKQGIDLSEIQASDNPAGVTSAINDGTRGYTIAVDTVTGISPLLSVGDYVDIWGTTSNGTVSTGTKLIEHVRIVALDATLSGGTGGNDYSRVTLELTDNQIQTLVGAGNARLAVYPIDMSDNLANASNNGTGDKTTSSDTSVTDDVNRADTK